MSVNKVILLGNLGSDPEVKTFPSGGKIATVSIATSERWTDKNTGELREHTEWHRLTFNNRQAEVAGQYLRKGSKIYAEGVLRTRKWTDPQGIERYTTEIRVDNFQMLDSRNNQNGGYQNQNYANQGYNNQSYGNHNPQNQYAPNNPMQGNQPNQYPNGFNNQNTPNFNNPNQPTQDPHQGYNPTPAAPQNPTGNTWATQNAPQPASNPSASQPTPINDDTPFGNADSTANAGQGLKPAANINDEEMPF